MNNNSNNFIKLFETIDKIRSEKYGDSISQEILFDLLNMASENKDGDADTFIREISELIEQYFEKKIIL